MSVVRAALVGLGRIAWMLESDRLRYHPCTHAGSLLAVGGARIVAGCDLESDRRERFAAWMKSRSRPASRSPSRLAKKPGRAGMDSPALYDGGEALARAIADGLVQVDLVVLATGPDSHPGLLKSFLDAGVRRFVIEKPVAMTSGEARRMLRMAQAVGARLHVNFERRYHPAYRLVHKAIEDGRFGPLRHIEGRVLAPSGDRDVLLEDAVHWIDLLLWYAGIPESVRSRYRLEGGLRERSSLHVFDYGEFDAVLESGGARRYFEFFMRLDFERGRIIAGNEGHLHFESRASRRYSGFLELAPVPLRVRQSNPWLNLYREVLQDRGCSSPLSDAVAGLEWIDRCRRFKGRGRTMLS